MQDELGSLIIDIDGMELSSEDSEILAHPLVGGVILFARNYDSREQITQLCRALRLSRLSPLLIMVDQEGGRVQRFVNDFTRLPPMALFGRIYEENSHEACRLAVDCGWLMAVELLSIGIDLSLAPVLDLNKGMNNVIGERAFHYRPQPVIDLAKSFIKGMQEAGMAATGKHFPGHGAVNLDSHVAVPQDHRKMLEVEKEDMLPFRELIKFGISAMMPAHIIFPDVDALPVGFSPIWLNDILRSRLHFNGVIISDDLNMEGANISANYADRMLAAREAGCDFTLLCNNRQGVIQILDHTACFFHRVKKEKWSCLQNHFLHLVPAEVKHYQKSERWKNMQEWLFKLTGLYHDNTY